MSRSCPGVSMKMPDLNMPFVLHATEVDYERRMHEMLRTDISSESDGIHLYRCCLPLSFSSFYPIREVDT